MSEFHPGFFERDFNDFDPTESDRMKDVMSQAKSVSGLLPNGTVRLYDYTGRNMTIFAYDLVNNPRAGLELRNGVLVYSVGDMTGAVSPNDIREVRRTKTEVSVVEEGLVLKPRGRDRRELLKLLQTGSNGTALRQPYFQTPAEHIGKAAQLVLFDRQTVPPQCKNLPQRALLFGAVYSINDGRLLPHKVISPFQLREIANAKSAQYSR